MINLRKNFLSLFALSLTLNNYGMFNNIDKHSINYILNNDQDDNQNQDDENDQHNQLQNNNQNFLRVNIDNSFQKQTESFQKQTESTQKKTKSTKRPFESSKKLEDQNKKNKSIGFKCPPSINCEKNYSSPSTSHFRDHMKNVHKYEDNEITKLIKTIKPAYTFRSKNKKPFIYKCGKECYQNSNTSSFRIHMKTDRHKLEDKEITDMMKKQNPSYKRKNKNK